MDDPKVTNKEILLFSMSEEVGALARALKIFEVFIKNNLTSQKRKWSCFVQQEHKVNLLHIESRSSKRSIGDYEFIVEIDTVSGDISGAIEGLRKQSSYFQIISRDHKDADGL